MPLFCKELRAKAVLGKWDDLIGRLGKLGELIW